MVKIKPTRCMYCGRETELSLDHLPPKSLFAKRYHAELPQVRACVPCNTSSSKDDEEFRRAIWMDERMERHTDHEELMGKVMRSMARPEARWYLHAVATSIEEVDIHSPAGVFLGKRPAYRFRQDRFLAVANRISRGLFSLQTGRLANKCIAQTLFWSHEVEAKARREPAWAAPFLEVGSNILREELVSCAAGDFEYGLSKAVDSNHAWGIFFRIHRHFDFLGLVLDSPSSEKS